MPLPLTNLDTRRWSDLVEEAHALIPRFAPRWTDHNTHDPGVTIIELLAWLVEHDVYRLNRVPDRHKRKFLSLVGFPPLPPQPAQTVLAMSPAPGAGVVALPAGTTLAPIATPQTVRIAEDAPRFRTTAPLTVMQLAISTVQLFDGTGFTDRTFLFENGTPLPVFGSDPPLVDTTDASAQRAIYLGLAFVPAPPIGERVSLWMRVRAGDPDVAERRRIAALPGDEDCVPPRPAATCEDAGDAGTDENATVPEPVDGGLASDLDLAVPDHHSVRTIWEYDDGAGWSPLPDLEDGTRGLRLDGFVRFTIPADISASSIGAIAGPRYYVRCRHARGAFDDAPVLYDVTPNAVAAVQSTVARATLVIAPGTVPQAGAAPIRGHSGRLQLGFDLQDRVSQIAFTDGDTTEVRATILSYVPATPAKPGSLIVSAVSIGAGTGDPSQAFELPGAPVAYGDPVVVESSEQGARTARLRADFDASRGDDFDATVLPTSGVVVFGDGMRGAAPAKGSTLWARYRTTLGRLGAVSDGSSWKLEGADDVANAALGLDVSGAGDALATVVNRVRGFGGADEESIDHAAGRAADALWAHEQLLDLLRTRKATTLDQIVRADVVARTAPPRSVTLADYERRALDAPGTNVRRAYAFASSDPRLPCWSAPGTVVVVIVPELPLRRPYPSAGLTRTVRAHLERGRTIGTRLIVTGPEYVEVSVEASVLALPGNDAQRVNDDVRRALDAFLDPLAGGPHGRGWPFGRDVFRSEILEVIDDVAGVDHVISLTLRSSRGDAQCENICVGAIELTTPGAHAIEVRR
jgi:predicted phage baseplate assembly protein